MPPSKIHKVNLQLVWTRPADLNGLRCLKCGAELDLDQPDIDEPARLIAYCCEGCDEGGTWHLLDLSGGPNHCLLLLLPGAKSIREAVAPHNP